ncbi:MAG TPA: ABC transporter permease [Oscillospiraceae bacterium]|nr:ABC transporter permease [Oscillospiraceae bacterium]
MLAKIIEYVFGNFDYILELIVQHLQVSITAIGLAIAVAVPLGILLTRYKGMSSFVMGFVGILQTIPSLALLAIMIPFLGIGFKPAVAALFMYSLLPILRNVYTGLNEVTYTMIKAARGMGMTSSQIIFKIQIPIAMPIIIAGIRTAAVICIGTATLAAFIGFGGLGTLIYSGIQQINEVHIFTGAFFSAVLALGVDQLFNLIEYVATPKGLRINK